MCDLSWSNVATSCSRLIKSLHYVVSRCDPHGRFTIVETVKRPDDTGGAAHSCAAGHTTCDKHYVSQAPHTNICNSIMHNDLQNAAILLNESNSWRRLTTKDQKWLQIEAFDQKPSC